MQITTCDSKRPFAVLFLSVVLLCGCENRSDDQRETASKDNAQVPDAALEEGAALKAGLAKAKSLLEAQAFDEAAKLLYDMMIRFPDEPEALLMTAKVEAARGRLDTAAAIAESIDVESEWGLEATQVRFTALAKERRLNEAADVLLSVLAVRTEATDWRHQAWKLLNHLGRRQEASEQAMQLCRRGAATEPELYSLIRRNAAFPTKEMASTGTGDAQRFADGLGKARWYFSLGDYQMSLEQLASQSQTEFECDAAEALYGRLLSESQRWDELRQWHANVTDGAKRFSDYWSALGTFFSFQRSHDAAIRSFLEGIRRDPTDRIAYQRLSNSLSVINRQEDAEQFRVYGIDLAQSVNFANALLKSPSRSDLRKQLAQRVLELGRPFETLAWTTTLLPADAIQPRRQIASQRANLLRDPLADQMTRESSLIGLDPSQFKLQPAIDDLLSASRLATVKREVPSAAILATPRLVNRAKEVGIAFQWYKDVEIDLSTIPIHESLGGGIAALDYDLDGYADIYLGQGSGDPPTSSCTRSNQLFRNLSGKFEEITEEALVTDFHYSAGLAAGDINQDGFLDLFLGSLGHNRVLINNGDGTFQEVTQRLGEFPDRFTASVAIADINGDALPDLFESNYIEMEDGFRLPEKGPDGQLLSPSPLTHFPASDRWFENLGDENFLVHEIKRDVAKPGTSLGLVITDFQSDGKNEVFVGIDGRPNHLLVQSGDNSFVNTADTIGLGNGFAGVANGCMGIATGDFDRDGRFDMQIANYYLEPANLYLQNDAGYFTDNASRFGLASETIPLVGFGTKAVDFDRNGFLDFIVSNGHIFDLQAQGEPYQMPPQVLLSDGRELKTIAVSDSANSVTATPGYWDQNYLGRTIAMLDYDRDGAMDFAVGHLDQPLALLHDETFDGKASDGKATGENQWIQFELTGTVSERDAIGAKVVLTVNGAEYSQWVTAGDGYFCSDEPVISFGFPGDDASATVDVKIKWTSGLVQSFSQLRPGNRYLIVEGISEATQR